MYDNVTRSSAVAVTADLIVLLLSTANALSKNQAKTKAAAETLKYPLFSISEICTFTSAQQLFVQLRLLYFDDGLRYAEVLVANYHGGTSLFDVQQCNKKLSCCCDSRSDHTPSPLSAFGLEFWPFGPQLEYPTE